MSTAPAVKTRPIIMRAESVRAILRRIKTQTRRAINLDHLKVRVRHDVTSDYPMCREDLLVCEAGQTYPARISAMGAVSAVLPSGRQLGLKPGEFDFVCPYSIGRTVLTLDGDKQTWRIDPEAGGLWVRETWRYSGWTEDGMPWVEYRADGARVLHERIPEEWADRLSDTWAELSDPDNFRIDERAADRRWRSPIHMPRWASRLTLEITDVRVERLQDISEDDAIAEGIDRVRPGAFGFRDYEWHDDPPRPTHPVASFSTAWDTINGSASKGWTANPWVWVIAFRLVERA